MTNVCARLRWRRRPICRRDKGSPPSWRPRRRRKVGNRLRSLGLEGQRDLLELFTRSAGDVLDQWFESDPIKAILGFDGIVGTYASPYAAGTGYVLLHHCWGEVNGKGVWGHAIGGMGAIAQAIARACAVRNVEIRTNCAVNEILVVKGRAVGVVTEKGEKIAARAIVSNLHPKLTFERLLDPAVSPPTSALASVLIAAARARSV